ncbi:MAG TPA: ABC transporter ATP-binding protein, partial [Jatrophihabitantaceae bacterium]|nr:ABC transporter ATP-binding protein [Jatrophihabitantaceae bacterium]
MHPHPSAGSPRARLDLAARRPAVDIRELVVERKGKRVLDDITVAIPTGSLTALLGPSGSGKTTLLRTIVGVQRITAGSVEVLGRPAGVGDLRRRVGYVTQAPSVYADLTVRENARYFASLYGLRARAADAAIADVGLAKSADQLTGRLSGGQRGRVSLACALLANPELLVLDEPTVGLDPVLRLDLWARFTDLAANGTTIVVSSHVMDEAARCERLVFIREGRMLADDTPADVRANAGTDDL